MTVQRYNKFPNRTNLFSIFVHYSQKPTTSSPTSPSSHVDTHTSPHLANETDISYLTYIYYIINKPLRGLFYAVSLARPFKRRRASTFRPLAVAFLFINPCSTLRWRLCGWYVRFGILFLKIYYYSNSCYSIAHFSTFFKQFSTRFSLKNFSCGNFYPCLSKLHIIKHFLPPKTCGKPPPSVLYSY